MHAKMKKMLEKKRDLPEHEKAAKMDVVKHLRDMASDAMGDKLDGLKKVSVASNTPEGLAHGLDKAKQIVSHPDMENMKNEAENPYGDYKAALDEHSDDEPNDQEGFDADQNNYADGGPVIDPSAAQSFQQGMRKATGYNEGGEVDESPDEDTSSDGYEARQEADDSEDGSPADAPESDEGETSGDDEEFHGLDMDAIEDKLQKLMKLRKEMSKKS
jgi:hypothetical protein